MKINFEYPLAAKHNSAAVHGVIAPYVMNAASLLSMEVLNYLSGFKEPALVGRVAVINMQTFETNFHDVQSTPGCPRCS